MGVDQVPAGQLEQLLVPTTVEYSPGSQRLHTLNPVPFVKEPAGHAEHDDDWANENWPGKHRVHAYVSGAVGNVPAGQMEHTVCPVQNVCVPSGQVTQLIAHEVLEYLPDAHREQLLGENWKYEPSPQSVQKSARFRSAPDSNMPPLTMNVDMTTVSCPSLRGCNQSALYSTWPAAIVLV